MSVTSGRCRVSILLMDCARHHRLRQAALALLAAWVLALVPSVSRALAWVDGSARQPAADCHDGALPGAQPGATTHLEHCGHCALAALPFAPPAGAHHGPLSVSVPAPLATRMRPMVAATHWPAAPARAPPQPA